MRIVTIVAMLCLSCGLRAEEPLELETLPDLTANYASKLAREAGLEPIGEGGNGDELRVWRDTSIIGLVSGWVVTRDGIRIYSNDYAEDDIASADGPVRLVRAIPPHHVREILASFRRFMSLDGQTISCPVKDGAGLFVEARFEGEVVAFAALNPGRCDVPNGKPLWRAFRRLSALAPLPL